MSSLTPSHFPAPQMSSRAIGRSGFLLCEAVSVPAQFACPVLLSASELLDFDPIFTTRTPVPVEAADAVALLVRSYSTLEVYNTNGGISSEGKLVSKGPSWIIKESYRRNLQSVCKRFGCSLKDLIAVDQSFRVKRARGGPVNIANSCGKTMCLVWYQTSTAKSGDLLGSWFDITLSNDPPAAPHLESKEEGAARMRDYHHCKTELINNERLVRICNYCHILDNFWRPHRRCARCKRVAYCSQNCQGRDWTKHKNLCTSREPEGDSVVQ